MQTLTTQLIYYEAEFGVDAANQVIQALTPFLEKVGNPQSIRLFKGNYAVNRPFKSYQEGQYKAVPKDVFKAILTDPNYLTNRGVLSILLRSSMNMWTKSQPS